MNKKRNILHMAAILLATLCLSAGCNRRASTSTPTVLHAKADTVAPLQATGASPSCSLKVDFSYLQADGALPDSVVSAINATLVAQLLGEDYAPYPAPEAVDRFKTLYVSDYLQDMQELYATDLQHQLPEDEIPTWYNRAFDLSAQLTEGREGVLCSATDIYEYAGGAHPNQWKLWMNFRLSDGHLLTTDEVFPAERQDEVSSRLLDALIRWARKELGNDALQSMADLQNEGVLLTSELYVPENFLLEADQVRFVFNRYDIAPYAVGAIELTLPYADVQEFMNPIN
jgi:hypothetical protein